MKTLQMDPEKKEKLLALGKWGDFLSRREELRAGGMRKIESSRVAYMEIVGEPLDGVASRRIRANAGVSPGSGDAQSGSAGSAGFAGSDGSVYRSASMSYAEAAGIAGARPSVPSVPQRILSDADFAGKRCTRSVAIEWAYVHCGLDGVEPADAPSSLAWFLMQDFRKSATYKFDLFKAVAVKAVAKEDLDGRDDSTAIDGQEEYDILGRLGGVAEGGAASSVGAGIGGTEA